MENDWAMQREMQWDGWMDASSTNDCAVGEPGCHRSERDILNRFIKCALPLLGLPGSGAKSVNLVVAARRRECAFLFCLLTLEVLLLRLQFLFRLKLV